MRRDVTDLLGKFGGPRRNDLVDEETGFFGKRTGSLDGDRNVGLLLVLLDNQRSTRAGCRGSCAIGSEGSVGRGGGQPILRGDVHTSISLFPNVLQGCTYNPKLSREDQETTLATPPLLPIIAEIVDAGAWTIKVITGEQSATSAFLALSNSFWDSDFK